MNDDEESCRPLLVVLPDNHDDEHCHGSKKEEGRCCLREILSILVKCIVDMMWRVPREALKRMWLVVFSARGQKEESHASNSSWNVLLGSDDYNESGAYAPPTTTTAVTTTLAATRTKTPVHVAAVAHVTKTSMLCQDDDQNNGFGEHDRNASDEQEIAEAIDDTPFEDLENDPVISDAPSGLLALELNAADTKRKRKAVRAFHKRVCEYKNFKKKFGNNATVPQSVKPLGTWYVSLSLSSSKTHFASEMSCCLITVR